MAKCKCGSRPRIVSNVCKSMHHENCCKDVCENPITGEPNMLGIFAPIIYDEIGVNLCASFDVTENIATLFPTATNASIQVIDATYTYGAGNVEISNLTGRKNCYLVTLSNIELTFALFLYDASCRLVGTLYPSAVYLPPVATAPTYDEDTNPTSVELEIFAPYGLSYDTTVSPLIPTIGFIGFNTEVNTITQGINLFSMAKLLDLDIDTNTITVGVTLVLQSLYFVGYKVKSAGRIDIPKGSIMTPENSDCMRFVAGDLLDLAIKPLDLGAPMHEECLKRDCGRNCGCGCTGTVYDETTPIENPPAEDPQTP